MTRIGAALALALLAGSALAQDAAFTLGNPDRRLWRQESDSFGGATRLSCFHSVCPPGTVVSVRQVQGSPRRPDQAAIRRIASQELPATLAREAAAAPRLTATTIQGWPAVRGTFEARGQSGNVLVAIAHVHLDGTVVQLTAMSNDRAYAPRALDAVIAASRFRRP
jgi:hypothetical protein